jgi:hypothetical protein
MKKQFVLTLNIKVIFARGKVCLMTFRKAIKNFKAKLIYVTDVCVQLKGSTTTFSLD